MDPGKDGTIKEFTYVYWLVVWNIFYCSFFIFQRGWNHQPVYLWYVSLPWEYVQNSLEQMQSI